jgi:hypothetical protein
VKTVLNEHMIQFSIGLSKFMMAFKETSLKDSNAPQKAAWFQQITN